MSQAFPNPSEFRADSPTCSGTAVGCCISGIDAILTRYFHNGTSTYNQTSLGRLAGAKHRAADHAVRHGICPARWCGYCVYLELKSRGLPVSWLKLTAAQFHARAKARLPMSVSLDYGLIARVSKASYSKTVPARGRSDSYTGAHQVVVWGVGSTWSTGAPRTYIVSDPDFGSPSRPAVPPYSLLSAAQVDAARASLGYGVCTVTRVPPALT